MLLFEIIYFTTLFFQQEKYKSWLESRIKNKIRLTLFIISYNSDLIIIIRVVLLYLLHILRYQFYYYIYLH